MSSRKTKYLAVSALFAALITAAGMIHLPIYSSQGYIHLADGIMYLAASVLPFPYAAMTAVTGGVLSDLLSGYFNWIPFTAIIKLLNIIPFLIFKKGKSNTLKAIIASVISGIITCVMYLFASRILYGNMGAAIADLPGNAIQAAAGAVIFILLRSVPALKINFNKDDKNG